VCIVIHMNKKQGIVYKTPKQKYLRLKELSAALEYGKVKSDKRIQVVMPSFVVNALDKEFPNTDRSSILTRLAVEALLAKIKYEESTELSDWRMSEQEDLDTMWNYLEERESE